MKRPLRSTRPPPRRRTLPWKAHVRHESTCVRGTPRVRRRRSATARAADGQLLPADTGGRPVAAKPGLGERDKSCGESRMLLSTGAGQLTTGCGCRASSHTTENTCTTGECWDRSGMAGKGMGRLSCWGWGTLSGVKVRCMHTTQTRDSQTLQPRAQLRDPLYSVARKGGMMQHKQLQAAVPEANQGARSGPSCMVGVLLGDR